MAHAYTELGGSVFLYGKPHPIYEAARAHVVHVPNDRLVAIKDLLDTDIRGARCAGIDSVLVTQTGGHALALGSTPSRAALDTLFRAAEVVPDIVLTRFIW